MSKKLARELRRIRGVQGHSLRQVEAKTKISNAYLSQLERGDAKNPSPHILHKLAKFYDVPYERLMEFAGYVHEVDERDRKKKKLSALQMALMSANLTPEEEDRIAKFIEFLKFEKRQGRT